MSLSIDLNCDLGEEPGERARDEELLALVSSVNVACGGHAGDAASMEHFARAAARLGVALGAHPSYPDREHFGRRELELGALEIAAGVAAQIGALREVAASCGTELRHVKPHGALYNRAARDESVAVAIGEAVRRIDPRLPVYGLAGSAALAVWRGMSLPVVAEAFADRRYEGDGTLRARRQDDALITDPAAAARQAVAIAVENRIDTAGGRVDVAAQSICVHADTPGSPAILRAVRAALAMRAVVVAATWPLAARRSGA
jgi:UPF0271 protein